MSVDLTALPIARAVPTPFRLGGTVRSALGGSQRINRLGDRWSFAIETRPMRIEPEGAQWAVLIEEAMRSGGLVRIRQPDFEPGPVGTPVVAAATAAGKSIPLSGLTPNLTIRARQWISIVVGGQRYLDKITAPVVVSAGGTATVAIANLIRAPIPAGASVELTSPKIEGSVEGDIGGAWEANRMTSFSFTVTEDA